MLLRWMPLIVLVYCSLSSVGVHADDKKQLPTAFNNGSRYTINYDDWDYILQKSVWVTGPSNRRPSSRAAFKNTATKIKHGNRKATALEGNRVLYHKLDKHHHTLLLAIRKDLESISHTISLEQLSKSEQLAYWLNLHNLAVVLEVSSAYPIKSIKRLTKGKRNVWSKKTMIVAGVPTSIQDIEKHIIANWKNPLVLYGLYMGAIGGPNIRNEAYTAESITDQLNDNAREFVNSLRGIRFWSGDARVSPHYRLGERFFPDFEKDIKAHMLQFTSGRLRQRITETKRFSTQQFNWGISDLKNGDSYSGSSYNTNPGALTHFFEGHDEWATSADTAAPALNIYTTANTPYRGLPPHVLALVTGIEKRNLNRERKTNVTVEEYVSPMEKRVQTKENK